MPRTTRALLLLGLIGIGCADPTGAPPSGAEAGAAASGVVPARLPYRLDAPDAVLHLPHALREISGLAWMPEGRLAAIEDERGVVYELDPSTGAVVRQTPFRRSGDFEGIAHDGIALWVVETTGILSRLAPGAPVERFDTGLTSRCDAEGLAWDADARRLLVACKDLPGPGLSGVRTVYAFDPATGQRDRAPAFLLERTHLDTRDGAFKPSAIAKHPTSGLWYVASAEDPMLVAVDGAGRLHARGHLPAALAPQPEGLAFAPDGTLFVATEGRPGRLLRYAPPAAP